MIVVKKLLLFSVASLFCFHPYAQKGKLEWGDLEKKSRLAPSMNQVLCGQGADVITLGFRSQGKTLTPVLTRFDGKLNQVNEKELFASEKNVNFNSLYNLKGNLVMFTKQFDKEDKFTTFHATLIDPVTLAVTGTKELGKFDAISKKNQANIRISSSPDSSSVLVFANAPYMKNENEKFFISVWDTKMNKVWDKMITLPYPDKFVAVDEFRVSNEGDVYVMCKHYDKEVSKERVREDGKVVPSYKYKIFIYGKNGGAPTEHTMDFQNKFVHDATLQFNADGNILMMGLYTTAYNSNVTGTFMAQFDKNTKLVNVKKMVPFPIDDLLNLAWKDNCGSHQEKNPGLFNSFKIIGTNKRNDGSLDLITEYNYMYIHRSSSSYGYVEYPVYVSKDIVVINHKPDGKIVYTRVPKSQKQIYTNVNISFKFMNQGNNLLLFYNDSKKNLARSLSKGPKVMKKIGSSEFVMASINDKGELQRQSVFSNTGMDVVTKISSCQPVSANTLIIYAEKDRRFGKTRAQFGSLKFL
jgi:hypothetical protein